MVIVVKRRARLLVGWQIVRRIGTIIRSGRDSRRISAIGYLGCRRNGTVVILFVGYGYLGAYVTT